MAIRTSRAKKASMAAVQQQAVQPEPHNHDLDYSNLLRAFGSNFTSAVANGDRLFTTTADNLFDTYLKALPGEVQVHTCRTCERFFKSYGHLATINENGTLRSALWADDANVPEFYRPVFKALADKVTKAKVSGVFLSADRLLGNPITGNWTHFSVTLPESLIFRHAILTPFQASAQAAQHFAMVSGKIAFYRLAVIDEALRALRADKLNASEKFIAPVEWLRDLVISRTATRSMSLRSPLIWRAIASAPSGFCHAVTGVVDELLTDIGNNLPFAEVRSRHNFKVQPTKYQRPVAPPKEGNVQVAEKLFEKMNLGPSLERRYARLDDCVQKTWTPSHAQKTAVSGLFGHLTTKKSSAPIEPNLALPQTTMTWEKFARTVLPTADGMQMYVPPGNGNYISLTTAVHADAPPILKHDHPEQRNPVSWYVYAQARPARDFNLTSNTWADVTAIVPLPTMWGSEPKPHLGDGMVFVLKDCRDVIRAAGCALFPEQMREELHEVRSVIEAYSKTGKLHGAEEASACGMDLRKGGSYNYTVRVVANGKVTKYLIDRWD